jgi:hypothetical protein
MALSGTSVTGLLPAAPMSGERITGVNEGEFATCAVLDIAFGYARP